MMTELLAFLAMGVSVVSFLTSLTGILIHYAKRHENPITAPLEQAIHALQLGQADIIDRVDHWTRRDRTRRLRADKVDDDVVPLVTPSPADMKQQLRAQARQMGIVR
jgi:hypothetical protein